MTVDLGTARGRIEIDAAGVDKGVKQAQSALTQFGGMATKALVGVGVAMAGVQTAVALMGKAWQTFERGAQIDAMQNRFERLADSIGSSGDALMARLQEATNGMMTSAELMSSATDIMSLGLGKTEDQTVRLATVVGKLGWDMQQVILTFANNSKMRLDALGLSVEDVTKRAKELEEQGYSTDAAFDMAVIEAGEAKVELLGDASQTTAGKLKILQTAVAEARDTFATAFTDQLLGQVEELTNSTEELAEQMQYAAAGAGELAAAASRPGLNLLVGFGKMAEVRSLGKAYQELGGDLAALQAEYQALFSGRLREEEEEEAIQRLREEVELLEMSAKLRDPKAWEEYYAPAVKKAAEARAAAAEFSGTALNLATHLTIAGERFKDATIGGGKFGDQLDAVADKAARTRAALDEAAQRAQAYAAAFGAVEGDYTTELQGADEPLVTPAQTVSVTTQVSGPTEAQRQAVVAYTGELESLRQKYFDLTNGVGTFGMEQGKLDEAIAETAGEIAHYEGLLAGIPPAVNDVSTSQQGLSVNVSAVRQGIYDQLVEMQAAPEIITAYATATGIMSSAQAEAVLQAAAVKVKIEELATAIAAGMPIDKALADLDAFILKMEQGVQPAAATMATTVPQDVADMGLAMWGEAITAGEGVPEGVAQGINDSLDTATTAATDAADAITGAVRVAHGIESPSSVFAEIGAQDIAGLIEGAAGMEGEAVDTMEGIGQSTTDAWDATIAASEGIGQSIMDGIIAGVESRRGALQSTMESVAADATSTTEGAFKIESPSRVFMDIGRKLIDGVIVGVERTERAMMERLRTLAGDARDTFLNELLAFERFGIVAALGEAAEGLLSIGDSVFGLQSNTLATNIDETTAQMVAAMNALRGAYGDIRVDNLLEMTPDERAYFLQTLRGDQHYTNDIDARLRLDEAIRLAHERNELEREYVRQQEELAALEEQRSRLDFLQTQVDLLNLIRENNLGADILDGLTLGLDASMTDILAAMTEATRQLIERANDELEIASPSAVFQRIGEQVMEGLAEGLSYTRDVQSRVRDALGRMTNVGLADARQLESRLRAGLNQTLRLDAGGLAPAQTLYNYGGLHISVADGTTADQVRQMFFNGLLYQGGA
jgi:hypothetical protein